MLTEKSRRQWRKRACGFGGKSEWEEGRRRGCSSRAGIREGWRKWGPRRHLRVRDPMDGYREEITSSGRASRQTTSEERSKQGAERWREPRSVRRRES